MHFIWPELLWLLLLIPLLVVGYIRALRRKRTEVVRYSSLDLIRPALGPGHRIRRHIPPALLLCALTLVLLGTARPSARISLPADYLTLVLAMDVSRSMLAEDVPPSRIVAAQQAAKSFLQELPDHVRVAVVSFAGNAQLVQGVTDQKDELLAAIDSFQLQRGTATGSGLWRSTPCCPNRPLTWSRCCTVPSSSRAAWSRKGAVWRGVRWTSVLPPGSQSLPSPCPWALTRRGR